MKLRIYLLSILLIFAMSTTSAFLLYFYMNIESNVTIGLAAMGTACVLAVSSFLALIFYFFKRIYYRGEVYLYTVHASLRQGFLVALGGLSGVVFYSLGVLNWKTGALLVSIIVLFELMIQSVSEN